MGALLKSLISLSFQAALVVVLIGVAVQSQRGEAQSSCTASLSSLNVCAPFVVPGSTNTSPSSDCCGALQAVQHDCLCNTIRVASQLPALCNLSPITCDVN